MSVPFATSSVMSMIPSLLSEIPISFSEQHIPKESVFKLYRLSNKKKFEYYHNGWITYRDLIDNAPIRNEKQLRQIEYALEDKGTYINKEEIDVFLQKLSYPLYNFAKAFSKARGHKDVSEYV